MNAARTLRHIANALDKLAAECDPDTAATLNRYARQIDDATADIAHALADLTRLSAAEDREARTRIVHRIRNRLADVHPDDDGTATVIAYRPIVATT